MPLKINTIIESSIETDADVVAGNALYLKSTGHVDKAKADDSATVNFIGLAYADTTTGNAVQVVNNSVFNLADWTAIIGAAELTKGARYYVSKDTAGALTSTAPTTAGEYVILAGVAITANKLKVEINQKYLL